MPSFVKATHAAPVWCCCRGLAVDRASAMPPLVEATLAALAFAIMPDKAFMAFMVILAAAVARASA